ncbi:MAG: PRC-barrel domain-containing protein [Pseudomonadota bacterium]
MRLFTPTAAALALTAGSTVAQVGYSSKAASETATGYTSTAIDTVPGNGVGASGEQPQAESGATADMGGTAIRDFGAEPESYAQVGIDIQGAGDGTTTPMVDPGEVRGGTAGLMGPSPDSQLFDRAQAAALPQADMPPGWEQLEIGKMTAADLKGATVLDENFQDIGTVSELVVDIRGELTEARLSIGGIIFGIGAAEVLVSMDDVHIHQDIGGDDIYLRVATTSATLVDRAAGN